jgi:hypothetical protein
MLLKARAPVNLTIPLTPTEELTPQLVTVTGSKELSVGQGSETRRAQNKK